MHLFDILFLLVFIRGFLVLCLPRLFVFSLRYMAFVNLLWNFTRFLGPYQWTLVWYAVMLIMVYLLVDGYRLLILQFLCRLMARL